MQAFFYKTKSYCTAFFFCWIACSSCLNAATSTNQTTVSLDLCQKTDQDLQSNRLDHYNWPKKIIAKQLLFEKADNQLGPENKTLQAICQMYSCNYKELIEELETTILYCIYNEQRKPIGAIQIDQYLSLEDIIQQVSPLKLAQELYNSKKTFEISYAISKPYRKQGLGGKAVKAWTQSMQGAAQSKKFFAVIAENNIASCKIIERCNFTYEGSYIHTDPSIETPIRLYTFDGNKK